MTRQRLRAYRDNKKEQEQLRQQLEAMEAALYAPRTTNLTGMPSGGGHEGSAVEDAAIKHMELVECYRAQLLDLVAEQLEIENALASLDGSERMIMREYYINGLTWEAVCVKVGYSWRQTHRIHKRALRRLEAEA